MGLALGNHLSYEGVAAVVRQVERAFEMSFRCGEKKKARIEKGEDEKPDLPPSLQHTPGWGKNKFMRQMMAARGIIRDERQRGERRLQMSTQKMTGSDEWWVFRTHGPLLRYQQREGILQAMMLLLKRSDKVPSWLRGEEVLVEEEIVVVEERAVTIQDSEDEPYDPEEAWIANADLEIEFQNDLKIIGDDEESFEVVNVDGEVAVAMAVEVEEKVVVEKGVEPEMEKEKAKRNCNEDEYGEDNVEWLLERLREVERKYKVEKEKNKAMKAEIRCKEKDVLKEQATVRLFRSRAAEKDQRVEELEQKFQRVNDKWKFMRNTYQARNEKGNIISRQQRK